MMPPKHFTFDEEESENAVPVFEKPRRSSLFARFSAPKHFTFEQEVEAPKAISRATSLGRRTSLFKRWVVDFLLFFCVVVLLCY
jgi:hypothetical protein